MKPGLTFLMLAAWFAISATACHQHQYRTLPRRSGDTTGPGVGAAPPAAGNVPDLGGPPSNQGQYRLLMRVLYAPGDQAQVGAFHVVGDRQPSQGAGPKSIPSGFWVYSAPYWYVWGHDTQEGAQGSRGQPPAPAQDLSSWPDYERASRAYADRAQELALQQDELTFQYGSYIHPVVMEARQTGQEELRRLAEAMASANPCPRATEHSSELFARLGLMRGRPPSTTQSLVNGYIESRWLDGSISDAHWHQMPQIRRICASLDGRPIRNSRHQDRFASTVGLLQYLGIDKPSGRKKRPQKSRRPGKILDYAEYFALSSGVEARPAGATTPTDPLPRFLELPDGGAVILGRRWRDPKTGRKGATKISKINTRLPQKTVVLIRLDEYGNKSWETEVKDRRKRFDTYETRGVIVAPDGVFFVSVAAYPKVDDPGTAMLARVDARGSVTWQWVGKKHDGFPVQLAIGAKGNLLVKGHIRPENQRTHDWEAEFAKDTGKLVRQAVLGEPVHK